jgi:carboxymethylenebutenolidase
MKLVEEHADLTTVQGPMRVHVHRPALDRRVPGLVLYSEIYQQTGPIARTARRLAGHGYVVAVPEVFHEHEPPGTVLPYAQEGTDKGNQYKYATDLATYDADARATLAHLAAHPACTGRLGAIGFCLGGHLALRAALAPEVAATACFYATDVHTDSLGRGKRSDTLARLGEVRGEVAFVWGRQDPHVPDAGRDAILRALRAAGTNFTWHEFNAVHAFMRDEGPRFDPALAELGYAIALEMFGRVLGA